MLAALAVLGYMHEWKEAHLFVGVRNVNEDFFTSDVTSLFTNGSCGIFPTIAASYPIANFPLVDGKLARVNGHARIVAALGMGVLQLGDVEDAIRLGA